ncbi:hypothetical protein COTS27_00525 [Spirochaetota bacterium]|nr:hypothetical protein COTS27_00525 [Spirochaetota bacterium]
MIKIHSKGINLSIFSRKLLSKSLLSKSSLGRGLFLGCCGILGSLAILITSCTGNKTPSKEAPAETKETAAVTEDSNLAANKGVINLNPLPDNFFEKVTDANANTNTNTIANKDKSNLAGNTSYANTATSTEKQLPPSPANSLPYSNASDKDTSKYHSDPVSGLDKLTERSNRLSSLNDNTTVQKIASADNPPDKLLRIAEVPALTKNRTTTYSQNGVPIIRRTKSKNAVANRTSPHPSLSQVKQLYKQKKYRTLTQYVFTAEELPQLYYKASAYFQLARRYKTTTRQQIEFVKYSKYLYNRIAETTRDPTLKGRSLLWLAVLKLRFPAWNEDLEQQLAPLIYIQRKLKNSRVYNDSLLYSAFVYESHRRYAKAYDYYRKLGQTQIDDWVYDDKISKFTNPKRASQWYLERLEARRLDQLNAPLSNLAIPTKPTPPNATTQKNKSSTANTPLPNKSTPNTQPLPTSSSQQPISKTTKSSTENNSSVTPNEETLATKLEEIVDFTEFSEEPTPPPTTSDNNDNKEQNTEPDSFTFD